MLHNKSYPVVMAGFFYGFSLYLNPVMIMLLPAIFIVLKYKNGRSGFSLFVFILFSILTLFGLIFYSFTLTNSWNFIKEAYYKAYHVSIY